MTENMKKYLELLSKDEEAKRKAEELNKKLEEQMKRETIALAAESGIELAEKDFEETDELSEDELDAVAGGVTCACAAPGEALYSTIMNNPSLENLEKLHAMLNSTSLHWSSASEIVRKKV